MQLATYYYLTIFGSIFDLIISYQLNAFFRDKMSQFLPAYPTFYSSEVTLLNLVEEFRKGLENGSFASIMGTELSKAYLGICLWPKWLLMVCLVMPAFLLKIISLIALFSLGST